MNSTESAPDDNNSTTSGFSTSSLDTFSTPDSDFYREMVTTVMKIATPILFLFGNVGNIISFVILRTGELRTLSTCFYMSILAVVDVGETYSVYIYIYTL